MTRDETHTVLHVCGHKLIQTTQIDMHDMTSIGDIPEHMRPTFVSGVGYVGGVSFDQLPVAYHKFIPGVPRYLWKDNGESIIECPSCHEYLQTEDMQPLV